MELTVTCERFSSRLTESGCKKYREANPDACRGCNRSIGYIESLPKCAWKDGCDSTEIWSRGLCHSHYHSAKKADIITMYPRIIDKKRENQEKNKKVKGKINITLVFESKRDMDILDFCAKRSKRERRSLDQQIIHMLENLMKGEVDAYFRTEGS